MFTHLIRATCDQCEKSVTMNTRGEVEAACILFKRGWVEVDCEYGNVAMFCSESCKKSWIDKTGWIEAEDATR